MGRCSDARRERKQSHEDEWVVPILHPSIHPSIQRRRPVEISPVQFFLPPHSRQGITSEFRTGEEEEGEKKRRKKGKRR